MSTWRLVTIGAIILLLAAAVTGCGGTVASQNNTPPAHVANQTGGGQAPGDLDQFEPAAIAFWDDTNGLMLGHVACSTKCESTVMRTSDGGASWKAVYKADARLAGLTLIDAQHVWAIASTCQDNGCTGKVLFSGDGGQTWQSLGSGPGAVSFADAQHGWGVPTNADVDPALTPTLLVTTDDGKTWTGQDAPCKMLASAQMASPQKGWVLCVSEPGAGNQGKTVMETTDGGRTWTTVANAPMAASGATPGSGLAPGGYPEGMQMRANGHGWFWEARGNLLGTVDGGRHWGDNTLTTPEVREAQCVWDVGDGTVYAVVRDNDKRQWQLAVSRDGGVTWRVQTA